MIFKLDGGVENILALTPVVAEWKRRTGLPVRIETKFPELLLGNKSVDEMGRSVSSEEPHIELGFLRWPLVVKNVMMNYAEKILGDTNMESWRTVIINSEEEQIKAKHRRPPGKVAAVSFGSDEIDKEVKKKILDVINLAGYFIFNVEEESSLRIRRAMISVSDLFVGVDGPTSSLAYTTDVPAIVIHTWRDPCYFWPFRRKIPFMALAPSERECSMGMICLANNGLSEYGKVYGCRCPMEPKFGCRKIPFYEMIRKALENILLRA